MLYLGVRGCQGGFIGEHLSRALEEFITHKDGKKACREGQSMNKGTELCGARGDIRQAVLDTQGMTR